MGSQKIYNFIDGNHEVLLKDVEYTNDPFVIAQQPKMTSIKFGHPDRPVGAGVRRLVG